MLQLDDFTTGRPWPPPSDAPRQARYKRNELLFDGQLDKVYGRWVRLISGDTEETHYALNFPRRLSYLWADLVFGEAPAITVDEPEPTEPEAQDALAVDPDADTLDVRDSDPAASSAPRAGADTPKAQPGDPTVPPDPAQQPAVDAEAPDPKTERQDALNELLDKTQLHVAGHESIVDVSRFGDAVIKLYRDEPVPIAELAEAADPELTAEPEMRDGDVSVEAINPREWFPIRNPFRPRRIDAHVLAWEIDGPVNWMADAVARYQGTAPKRPKRLVVEVHESGTSTYRVYELEHGGKIGSLVSEETEETGLDVPIVFHIPGPRTSGQLFGRDDYTAADSPLEYIVWLMAARQSVILKHQDPSIIGPPGQLKQDDRGELVYDAGSAYFEIDDPQTTITPEYLTWDGKLDAAFTQTEALWNDLYTVTETSPVAFSATKDGFAESGTSLKLRMQAPLKKAERITRNLDPVWREIIRALAELASVDIAEGVTIEWRDGLPSDDKEASEISAKDIASGLTSKLSERMRRYGMTEQQARDEQERIDEESKAAGPSFADRLLNAPAGITGDDPADPLGLDDGTGTAPKGVTPPQLAPHVEATKRAFGKA